MAVNDIVIVEDVKDDLGVGREFSGRGRRVREICGGMTAREFAGGYSMQRQNLIEWRGWVERGDKYAVGEGPQLSIY